MGRGFRVHRGKGCTSIFFYIVEGGGGWRLIFFFALRYDSGITSVMPGAGGCLTRKNTLWCRAFLAQCRAVFVDFCYFLLLIFTIGNFYKLLFTVFRDKFYYFLLFFFTACKFQELFFIVEKDQGLYCIHCAMGELERVHLDFFLFIYFYC
jgi:hypothetical protein